MMLSEKTGDPKGGEQMYRVMIVDDELPALRFVQNIIEKFTTDYQIVSSCTSGEQALEYLNHHTVDLIVTDISMHGMNGIDLARFARDKMPDIHILIITGYGEFE